MEYKCIICNKNFNSKESLEQHNSMKHNAKKVPEARKGNKKYLLVFFITATIFVTAFTISDNFNKKRLDEISSIQDKIALDIAASETQFALLGERSCDLVGESTLSKEIGSLASKLSYTESELGSDSPEVLNQKKYYSLLQVKDFLLSKKMTEKCGWRPITILYFYSNTGDCVDCTKEGYVLTNKLCI